LKISNEAKKRLVFLEEKLDEYLRFPKEHPESNEEHIRHKMTVLVPQLRRAIEKCKEDSFRNCDDCGGEIGKERLNKVVTAIRCVECQEALENPKETPKGDPKGRFVSDEDAKLMADLLYNYREMVVSRWALGGITKEEMSELALNYWSYAVEDFLEKTDPENLKKFKAYSNKEKVQRFGRFEDFYNKITTNFANNDKLNFCTKCKKLISTKQVKEEPEVQICRECLGIKKSQFDEEGKKKSDPVLLEIFSSFTSITVRIWNEEKELTDDEKKGVAYKNWERAISEGILALEGKNEQKEIDLLSKEEKTKDFEKSDLSFRIFLEISEEIYLENMR